MKSIFQPTVLFAIALMVIILMMILPMPAWVLDVGLAVSFSLAILIFTVTVFIERPLDFSSFPTILLGTLMLRLSLNVSSTKLIVGEGHKGTHVAGDVIEGFSMFVMGGSIIMGLVVFCVLLIVNFMVITKGATRMAEVGARFALDAMPGKQLAIDSDVSAGGLNHEQAKSRREIEQAETTFFGSLDGASKFVKGDAIAGLLITLLNLFVGLLIGVVIHDMAIETAFETYAILTVGDGLVSQIPAVIVSIASALLLSRGGTTGASDSAIFSQLAKYPAALGTVSLLMAVFAAMPGLPFLPFFVGALVLACCTFYAARRAGETSKDELPDSSDDVPTQKSMGDLLDIDDIHVEFAPDLVGMVLDPATGLDMRISNMRNHVATKFGVILPEVRLTDNASLPAKNYTIKIMGVEQARDILSPDQLLALVSSDIELLPSGRDVAEPVYGAPARWIDRVDREEAALSGNTIVTPAEVLATHLLEVIKKNFSRLMTMKALRRLLEEMTNLSDSSRADANRRMIDELIPEKVPVDLLLIILRLLLEEQVSIRNMTLILESIAEVRSVYSQPEIICEHVRQRMGFQLVSDHKREDGTLPLLQLAPEWETIFSKYNLDGAASHGDVALPPEDFNRLADGIADGIARAAEQGINPAIVTSGRRRRFVKTVLAARGLVSPVLSFEELGVECKPSIVGQVVA
ncbi:MAG: flagellar biosynthesis protein FlhA [Pseudomonadota bacterium]